MTDPLRALRAFGEHLSGRRDERGESVISIVIGVFIGSIILGAFALFYFTANDASTTSVSRAEQEAAGVQVMNRAGRDIATAAEVLTAKEDEVVVRQVIDGEKTKVRYAVVQQGGQRVLVRQVDRGENGWDAPQQVLGRDVVIDTTQTIADETKFVYRTATGAPLASGASPAAAGLVDITYVANTKTGGKVTLRSSAAVDSAIGGTTTGEVVDPSDPPPATPPSANPVNVPVTFNSSATGYPSTTNVEGTPVFTASTTPPTGMTVSVDASTGAVAVSVNSSYTGALNSDVTVGTYTVTGSNGSATSSITVRVVPASATATQPLQTQVCGTAVNDQINVPSRTGVVYRRGSTSGAQVSGTVTMASATETYYATAAYGYTVTSSPTSWTYTDARGPCQVQAPVVKAHPTAAPSSATATSTTDTIAWTDGTAPFTVYRVVNGVQTQLTTTSSRSYSAATSFGVNSTYRVVDSTGASGTDTSLQFPTQPYANAAGSDGNFDGIADRRGTNAIGWTKSANNVVTVLQDWVSSGSASTAPTVTSVQASIVDPTTVSTSNCKSGAGTSCALATGLAAGSEHIYRALEYATCDPDLPSYSSFAKTVGGTSGLCGSYYVDNPAWGSSDYASALGRAATAYQAPNVAPTGTTIGSADADSCFATYPKSNASQTFRTVNDLATDTDSNGYYRCADNVAKLGWTGAAADTSAPSGSKFCSYAVNSGTTYCSSRRESSASDYPAVDDVARRSGSATAATLLPGALSVPAADGWGGSTFWTIVACNPGGCSNGATTVGRSFPGPFAIDNFTSAPNNRTNYNRTYYQGASACWNDDTGCAEEINRTSTVRFDWSGSLGSETFRWSNTSYGGLATGGAYDLANQKPEADQPGGGLPRSSGGFPVREATNYEISVSAQSATGGGSPRLRYDYSTFRTAPPPPVFAQDAPFCTSNASVGDRWKYAVAFRPQAADNTGDYLTAASVDGFRYQMWAGQMTRGQASDIGAVHRRAGAYWLQASNTNDWPANDAGWGSSTNVWAYGSVAPSTSITKAMLGGVAGDKVIPMNPATGLMTSTVNITSFRLESYTTKAGVGNPEFMDASTAHSNNTPANAGPSKALLASASPLGLTCTPSPGANTLYATGSPWSAYNEAVTRRSHLAIPAYLKTPRTTRWAAIAGYPS